MNYNDYKAFVIRLECLQPDMLRMAKSILGANYDLDPHDLVQKTNISAIRFMDKFVDRGGNSFQNWLFTIMKRTFFNDVKKINRRRDKLTIKPYRTKEILTDITHDLVSDDNMAKIIDTLPKSLQTTFNYYIKDYKYNEIANILGISESNVKHKIRKAKLKLQKSYSKEDILDMYS